MDDTALTCRDEQRRAIARQRNFNGIDYVSIGADQTTLCVHLFGEYPSGIDTANVRVEGGRRVRNIKVLSVRPEQEEDPELGECMHIELDKAGDFSTYKLCLVEVENGRPTRKPFKGLDPRYSCIELSFKVDCPGDLDCKDEQSCPPEPERAPDTNYLAKDYASFRQLILDRLALLIPDWRERHVPDIGITLVELLAYVGDHLSYYQDAVATEAYLDTARQRISVRRHARLVDYQMHEGCNARAFVFVETSGDLTLDPRTIYFITRCAELERAGKRAIGADEFDQLGIPSSRYEVFMPMIAPRQICGLGEIKNVDELTGKLRNVKDESALKLRACLSSNTQHLLVLWKSEAAPSDLLRAALADEWERLHSSDIRLYQAHSEIPFYTWGDAECCLPRGATRATLKDGFQTRSEDEPTSKPDYQPKYEPTYGPKNEPTYGSPAYAQAYVPAKDEQQQERLRKLNLAVGDVLIFEEVIGPKTGNPADADPAHRHAVRLTRVEPGWDPLFDQPVVEIEWAEEDALPFTLCISAVLPAPDCQLVEGISVARGNVILVDHGQAIDPPEPLGQVPLQTTVGECECGAAEMSKLAGKFRPSLKRAPLTFSAPLSIASGCIGLAQYAGFLFPSLTTTYWQADLHWLNASITVTPATFVAMGTCLLAVFLLYRNVTIIGRISEYLWVGVMLTIAWVIVSGVTHFNSARAFDFPQGAFVLSPDFFKGLGAAMLIAVYDYWGYYNVCFIGGEIRDPGRTIPRAILFSIFLVGIIYIVMNISILGVIPWRELGETANSDARRYIISVFMQRLYGLISSLRAPIQRAWGSGGHVHVVDSDEIGGPGPRVIHPGVAGGHGALGGGVGTAGPHHVDGPQRAVGDHHCNLLVRRRIPLDRRRNRRQRYLRRQNLRLCVADLWHAAPRRAFRLQREPRCDANPRPQPRGRHVSVPRAGR